MYFLISYATQKFFSIDIFKLHLATQNRELYFLWYHFFGNKRGGRRANPEKKDTAVEDTRTLLSTGWAQDSCVPVAREPHPLTGRHQLGSSRRGAGVNEPNQEP